MSLDWHFTVEGKTTSNLTDEGASLFAFLTYMMACGVNTLKSEKDRELFLERAAIHLSITDGDAETLLQLDIYSAELLECGLSTNISPRTNAQFKSFVWDTVKRQGESMKWRMERLEKDGEK